MSPSELHSFYELLSSLNMGKSKTTSWGWCENSVRQCIYVAHHHNLISVTISVNGWSGVVPTAAQPLEAVLRMRVNLSSNPSPAPSSLWGLCLLTCKMGREPLLWVPVKMTWVMRVKHSAQYLVHSKHSVNLAIGIIHSLGRGSYTIENLCTKTCTQECG